MAHPIWITKAGNLGLIPENEYFEQILDAYDPAGEKIKYSFLAGQMPPGLYVHPEGRLAGVPVVTDVNNVNNSYTFTVRATNVSRKVADRTFSLTITNIVPPEITPKVAYLGNYFDGEFLIVDGSYFNFQLRAIEVNPNATLTWEITAGSLPNGLSMNKDGLISGFIIPLPAYGDAGKTGYSNAPYSEYGYDNAAQYRNNAYTFTVRVFDGINYDSFTYRMNVTAKGNYTADNTSDVINDTFLTIDADNLYVPIIVTPPQSLPEIRSGSHFAFKFDAIDPNGDIVAYSIATSEGAGFDSLTAPFDTAKFDQGATQLPPGLGIDQDSGWLNGFIPIQSEAVKTYEFIVYAYKRDRPAYISTAVNYTLTVLGDVNNTITWQTDSNLGVIDNGAISEISISAVRNNNTNEQLVYTLIDRGSRLPQGLELSETGLIVGRATFEYFSIDSGSTTIDKKTTVFDNKYTFTVKAQSRDGTVSSTKTFSVKINNFNKLPYENVYLQALPNKDQREIFTSIVSNKEIFPEELIYRPGDPWFGRASTIKSLFIAGVNPTFARDYISAMNENHFTKRIEFGNIKTARALDENFNVKYEVVYLELLDNQTDQGRSPSDVLDLTGKINPWYDEQGNAFSVVYPNSFNNMSSAVVKQIGYANQGALPAWMTSTQENGKPLGFTRSVVLAYTKPGASKLMAYRLATQGLEFNNIDFVVDRYVLDNYLSENYNISVNKFITGRETTFDRIARGGSSVTHSVTFAVRGKSFSMLHNHSVGYIQGNGGFDGVTAFNDGDTLIFAQQETYTGESGPNDGWNWDNTDSLTKIPGYVDHLLNPDLLNQRAGVWRIRITTPDGVTLPDRASDFGNDLVGFDKRNFDAEVDWENPPNVSGQLVTLEFVEEVQIGDFVQINEGTSSGQVIMYYDPILKTGKTVPEYTLLPSDLASQNKNTRFDSNGTRFISDRDSYSEPGTNDKYLRFPKTGVFK